MVDTEGVIVDRLPLSDAAFTLNCCFGSEDGRTLFVTDAWHSTLLAFEGMPVPGAPGRPAAGPRPPSFERIALLA